MRIIESKKVKTRKVHECVGCLKNYPKGTEMNVVTYVDYDPIAHAYWCPTCQRVFDEMVGEDTGIFPGSMRTNDPDYWEKIRQEVENDKS